METIFNIVCQLRSTDLGDIYMWHICIMFSQKFGSDKALQVTWYQTSGPTFGSHSSTHLCFSLLVIKVKAATPWRLTDLRKTDPVSMTDGLWFNRN